MKLLLATDDLDLARALGAAIRSHGIRLEHCLDPDDVVGRSWRALPDVIMVDLDLPLASGFTLLRRLQNDTFSRDIPVLVTSAALDHLSEEVELCWRRLGTQGFLPRPFSMLEVPDLLHDIATSGWTIDDEDNAPTLHGAADEPSPSVSERSQTSTGPISLGELRLRRREEARERSQRSLTALAGVVGRSFQPSGVSARELTREFERLRLAPPRRVLGLGGGAMRQDIRYAAIRKTERLTKLRDDRGLVPEVRAAAQQLLELVRTAEACLLGRLV